MRFPYDPSTIAQVEAIPGHRWHPDKKTWSFPRSEATLTQVLGIFKGGDVRVDAALQARFPSPVFTQVKAEESPSDHLEQTIQRVRRELRLRNYSLKTIKAYTSCLRSFLEHFRTRKPQELTGDDIRTYLLHLIEGENFAASSINQVINVLRFLYVEILKKPFAPGAIPRPRKERKLPTVLSLNEVETLFDVTENRKHRVILMLIYSAGLRLSELIKLKPEDVDSDRKLIHVRGAKGKKDRYTLLSDVVLNELRKYWKQYRPGRYLFEGQSAGKPIAPRTVQKIFEQAVKKAGIAKHVSVHSLRHAFATHLLEQGTDLRYIQELLGHESSRTTEIYTHVSNKSLGAIVSPIDRMMRGKVSENPKGN